MTWWFSTKLHLKEHYRENVKNNWSILYDILSEVAFLSSIKVLISVLQSYEHWLCVVNSGWTDNYKLWVTLVSQVKQAASFSLLVVLLGRDKCHHPSLIWRVSIVSAPTDSNRNPREMQAIMGPAGRYMTRDMGLQARHSLTQQWYWPVLAGQDTALWELPVCDLPCLGFPLFGDLPCLGI